MYGQLAHPCVAVGPCAKFFWIENIPFPIPWVSSSMMPPRLDSTCLTVIIVYSFGQKLL